MEEHLQMWEGFWATNITQRLATQNVLSQEQHTVTAKNADYGVSFTHEFLMLMHYFYA